MKTNKEKFLGLVSEKKTNASIKNKERIAKREMFRESRNIAFKILEKLDDLKWSQKQLAEAMEVSPQYVNKLVKGKENFTLETQIKIQKILSIPILASYYESNKDELIQFRGEDKLAIIQSSEVVYYNVNITITHKIGTHTSNHYLQAC